MTEYKHGRDNTTLDIFADKYVTLSKSEYNSLIQKMHSISTSDITILTHPGVFYLASSSPSSWIIDSGVSTYMSSKFTVFFTFHTSSAPSIVFFDGSFKCSTATDTVNLTSLALTDVNYIPYIPFNLIFLSCLTKALLCSITFSSSSCIFQDL